MPAGVYFPRGSPIKAFSQATLTAVLHFKDEIMTRDVRVVNNVACLSSLKAIFHCSRFARAGGATNFNHVKNHEKSRPGTPRKLNVVLLSWRVREHAGSQKMHMLGNYRES